MSAKAKLKYVLFGAVFAGGFASLSLELAVMRPVERFCRFHRSHRLNHHRGAAGVYVARLLPRLDGVDSPQPHPAGSGAGFYRYRADVGAGFLLYSDRSLFLGDERAGDSLKRGADFCLFAAAVVGGALFVRQGYRGFKPLSAPF